MYPYPETPSVEGGVFLQMIPTLHFLCSRTCRIFTVVGRNGPLNLPCAQLPTSLVLHRANQSWQTVDLIASSGLSSWDLYHVRQKQHFHERFKHHILCSSIIFHDLFKTYNIYNHNEHKDSKTWLIQHAPPTSIFAP